MNLAEQLRLSFREDDSDANLRKWGKYISENDIDLKDLLGLLDEDRFTAMRFLWLTGGLVEIDPQRVAPAISYFFSKRHTINVPNYDRSVAKFCSLAGIPAEIEGEVVDLLFQWILDPKVITTTKTFAVLALYNQSQKYPDLKNELRIVIEDQLDKNGVSFEKRAGNILAEL
ncbi:MAG: hypothetical protein A3D31_11025 [Candidatus Fluviicola riflensis]|nr:MAG: hypothetical protein CHH17_15445 [Candidatus Fluviicola riflensis]OGS77524.1 MAG: hypothetical protein A3D31_11025 [Candidatus Fluviicola riflensis]OGS84104.1 MAG: hypothetical protein A3E30_12425 [Fluviicola sp. RIFCSPHIGHO2_12_FULL_43_24]OGS84590.1 MAG: hypothetical protein A2724_07960 [Fluviicola sp. RIFCSPHIGHO2_01_FULL_43_53]